MNDEAEDSQYDGSQYDEAEYSQLLDDLLAFDRYREDLVDENGNHFL